MLNCLIDGRVSDAKDLDPAKHKFIGTFRWPLGAFPDKTYTCPVCRKMFVHYSHTPQHLAMECWTLGHLDIAQYQTISEPVTTNTEGSDGSN